MIPEFYQPAIVDGEQNMPIEPVLVGWNTSDQADFNRAVSRMCGRLYPHGFDISDTPPNSYIDLAVHVARTGRMCVAKGCSHAIEFDSLKRWQQFRAWHDYCHIEGGHPFTLAGECAAVRMQIAMLRACYPSSKVARWTPILVQQIIHDNFGEAAFCPATLRSKV